MPAALRRKRSMAARVTRRSHKKSYNGCIECKRRRVKVRHMHVAAYNYLSRMRLDMFTFPSLPPTCPIQFEPHINCNHLSVTKHVHHASTALVGEWTVVWSPRRCPRHPILTPADMPARPRSQTLEPRLERNQVRLLATEASHAVRSGQSALC